MHVASSGSPLELSPSFTKSGKVPKLAAVTEIGAAFFMGPRLWHLYRGAGR